MAGLNENQREQLRNNFGIKSLDELSEELQVSKVIVAQEIRAMNLKKRNLKKFEKEEVEILKQHYRYLSYGELGTILKRNRTVIFSKIKELGLEKNETDHMDYKRKIAGLEDSIMCMSTNLKYSTTKIKKTLDTLVPENGLTLEMITSFLFVSTPTYTKSWKLFNKSI